MLSSFATFLLAVELPIGWLLILWPRRSPRSVALALLAWCLLPIGNLGAVGLIGISLDLAGVHSEELRTVLIAALFAVQSVLLFVAAAKVSSFDRKAAAPVPHRSAVPGGAHISAAVELAAYNQDKLDGMQMSTPRDTMDARPCGAATDDVI
jgi:hypothetical protein